MDNMEEPNTAAEAEAHVIGLGNGRQVAGVVSGAKPGNKVRSDAAVAVAAAARWRRASRWLLLYYIQLARTKQPKMVCG
jgi:hypothetical protein